MPVADQRTLRTAVIEQVLGTDMKKHFNILSRFQVSDQCPGMHTAIHTMSLSAASWLPCSSFGLTVTISTPTPNMTSV